MESWIGPILFGPVLGLVLALVLVCTHLWISLRRQNLVVESLEARVTASEEKLKKRAR